MTNLTGDGIARMSFRRATQLTILDDLWTLGLARILFYPTKPACTANYCNLGHQMTEVC